MIKIILGVLISVFVLVSTVMVLYWRDTNHDPSGQDLLIFFGLVPVAFSLLILMPFFVKKWYDEHQEKKNNPELAEEKEQKNEKIAEPIEWIKLHVFTSSALSALGENKAIWTELKDFKSPELDHELLNGYGLPILSYRILEIDERIENEGQEEDDFGLNTRQQRIESLVTQQLEQHTDTLWQVAEHIKQSALFYEGQLVQEYRMHPAWIDPNADRESDQVEEKAIEQVTRLNQLHIHLILAEDLLHTWDESSTQEKFANFLNQLGYIPQKFHVEHHYWGKETAYKNWLDLLQQIEKTTETVSLMVAVDSEIDQDTLDEKIWVSEKYLPAEFIGSCCIAPETVLINGLMPQKMIKIALNEPELLNTLELLNNDKLEQFQEEQPFVIQLDDVTDLKVVKRLEKNFGHTPIEQHHYLYLKQSIGQTENIAKVFGFMVALQGAEELMTMVYSCEQPQTQTVIQTVENLDMPV